MGYRNFFFLACFAVFGKCAITGEKLEIGNIHCHHKLPKHLGGSDEYKNLVIVSESVHRLIHATNPEIIRKYLQKLNLDAKTAPLPRFRQPCFHTLLRQTSADFTELPTLTITVNASRSIREGVSGRYPLIPPFG